MPIRTFQRAVITGASSGIGAALAECYARQGTDLLLTGRNSDRLQAIKTTCEAQGVAVTAEPVDVRDAAAMGEWLTAQDDTAPIDLVIANAGISGDTSGVTASDAIGREEQIYAVNILGVRNTIDPLVARFRGRGHGQIGLVSSLAGFRGLPSAPAYAASKA
ncbi:MAG: SDR family NAD(P)-dependent oxidoreductase, partial [Proteobacteria bacterium]|nr:SDR family NAD(P)-dependent oxidoreductase [Pseudomonadota bacterium]